MLGINTKNGEIQVVNNDFATIQDIDLLTEELWVFLNIRAAHRGGQGNIVRKGEHITDQDIGLDHIIIFDSGDLELIKSHVNLQILRYFSDRITAITEITAELQPDRHLMIYFNAQTIYGTLETEGVI